MVCTLDHYVGFEKEVFQEAIRRMCYGLKETPYVPLSMWPGPGIGDQFR